MESDVTTSNRCVFAQSELRRINRDLRVVLIVVRPQLLDIHQPTDVVVGVVFFALCSVSVAFPVRATVRA